MRVLVFQRGGVVVSGFSMDGWVDPVVLCMKKEEEEKRTKLEVWGG
jgi:hypothetical protein